METQAKKKIGLIGAILMGIGCIVGSGIFGTLPAVANSYGAGVVWALLGAAVLVIINSITGIFSSSALPSTAANFLWSEKLLHPYVGVFVAISTLLLPTMVSLFGVLFADYFIQLFPGLNISPAAASVGLLVVFTAVAWFGNKTSVSSSNLMVILLIAAIFLYIVLGLPSIDPANVTFGDILNPGVSLSSLAAAIGVLKSSLSGASSVYQLADDIDKPERNVPIALAVCPLLVALIYILMAVVTIGVVPAAEVTTLAEVASHFMSPSLYIFFIVGGPICGIITSLVPVALACVAMVEYSARARIFPAFLAKRNRHGTAYWSLALVMVIAVAVCSTGAAFGVVMTIFSVVNTLSGLPLAIVPIYAYKKYPNCCKNCAVKIGPKLMAVISIAMLVINVYLCVEMMLTLDWISIGGILAVYALGIVYMVFRIQYLKGKGIDLIAELKEPFAPWEEKERSYKA